MPFARQGIPIRYKEKRETVSYTHLDDLAEACHISHTTIIRFARKLGLKGFGELKFILRWQNQQALAGFQPAEIEQVAQDYQQTLEYIRTVDLNDLFHVLEHARTIYVLSLIHI